MKRVAIVLIVMLGLMLAPSPVYAAGVSVESTSGDGTWDGSTWTVEIYPSEVKSRTIELHNSASSALEVWVSIVPDSLDDGNLTFKLDETNFIMPGGSNVQVTLNVRASGSTTPGVYTAELEIKSEVAPEPTPVISDGGGGWWVPPPPPGTTDVRGMVGTGCRFTRPATVTSEDGLCTLTIPTGTVGLTEELGCLTKIKMVVMDEPPPPPADAHVIGLVYDFGPDGITFDPPVTLTWSYDPANIPEGIAEEDLVIAYYDDDAGVWVELECEVDTENNIITAKVTHFTIFTLLGAVLAEDEVEEVEEAVYRAAFAVSGLVVSPREVYVGESVSIRILVANTGGESGSYNVMLKINGVIEAAKDVTVSAGLSKEVTFSVAKDTVDIYSVDVNGLLGSFTVRGKPAAFAVSDLVVTPREVYVGEPVAIEVLVANTGGESGSYEVSFKINGAVKEAKELTLSPGSSQKVVLTTVREDAGTYEVDVNGLIGSFMVKEKPEEVVPPGFNWPLTGGIIAATIVVGLLIFFLIRGQRMFWKRLMFWKERS